LRWLTIRGSPRAVAYLRIYTRNYVMTVTWIFMGEVMFTPLWWGPYFVLVSSWNWADILILFWHNILWATYQLLTLLLGERLSHIQNKETS